MSQLKVNTIRHSSASSDAITLASDGTCTAKITNNLSNRNLIINGAMNIAQRGTSSTSSGYNTVDRFRDGSSGNDEAPTYEQADVASGTTPFQLGFRKCLKITNGNQTGGAGAGDRVRFEYRIEAQDIANSGWNYTSASSYITLSFWVKSSVAQNFYARIYSADGTPQAYSFETGALSADTWTKVTKKIPGNSNLQFDNNTEYGVIMSFAQYAGSDYTDAGNTMNTWAAYAGTSRYPTNTSTWYTTNDATWEITGLQLEVGDVATDFEHRSYGDELARCQRYYYLHALGSQANANNSCPVATTANYTAALLFGAVHFPVTMRAFPTIDTVEGTNYFRAYDSGGSDTFDNIGLQQSGPNAYIVQFYGNLSMTAGNGSWVQTANAAAKIAFKAEL